MGQGTRGIQFSDIVNDPTIRERFLARIDQSGGAEACWPWQRSLNNKGYGRMFIAGTRNVLAHRVSFLLFNGEIPAGLDVDHNCHNLDLSCPGGDDCRHRRCCNPAHLRAVTRSTNNESGRSTRGQRRTPCAHCRRGHEMTPENSYTWVDVKNGRVQRQCRICTSMRGKMKRARRSS